MFIFNEYSSFLTGCDKSGWIEKNRQKKPNKKSKIYVQLNYYGSDKKMEVRQGNTDEMRR